MTRLLLGCLGCLLAAVTLHAQPVNLPRESDLLAYWKFNEGKGDKVYDHSGHNRHGTLINGPRWEHGVLHFAGRYDCVEIPTSDELEFGENSAYSIVLVLRVHQMPNTGWAGLFTKGRDKGNWLGLWLAPDRNWNYAHGGSNLGIFSPAPDRWSHVVCSYNQGVKSFYLDGVKLSSGTDRRGSANYGKIFIGGSGNFSEYANFSIAEGRIYNTAITDEQVAAMHQELWRSGRLGGAMREYWLGAEGATVESFTGSPRFAEAPSGRDIIYSMECPAWDNRQVTQGWSDNYAQRIRAWLVPDESSYYEFLIAADEHAVLRLGTDDNAATAHELCRTMGYTEPMDWYRTPEQLSAPVYLQAGARYYFEVVHKEAFANDHLEVGWSRIVNELSGDVRIITGENLVPYTMEAAAVEAARVAEIDARNRAAAMAAARAYTEAVAKEEADAAARAQAEAYARAHAETLRQNEMAAAARARADIMMRTQFETFAKTQAEETAKATTPEPTATASMPEPTPPLPATDTAAISEPPESTPATIGAPAVPESLPEPVVVPEPIKPIVAPVPEPAPVVVPVPITPVAPEPTPALPVASTPVEPHTEPTPTAEPMAPVLVEVPPEPEAEPALREVTPEQVPEPVPEVSPFGEPDPDIPRISAEDETNETPVVDERDGAE